jgi:ribosome-associated protein
LESVEFTKKAVDLLDDKKALDIISLDVRKVTTLTDFFIICSGTSDRHRKALADNLQDMAEKNGMETLSKEGYGKADWILLDYGHAVVNIFSGAAREKFNLERLWSDGRLADMRTSKDREEEK